ncbi:YceI family protein [Thermoplasma sp.]|uniref:YceI family protein n=1 Tax=Thermoplasma sp. TaxID=1973142 RepID=UPI00126B150F|nr:YceI family protein [Thermoplasma sp.]KAA8922300.1 MAG: polyisoprenoid-binding protein [Thermoplasma sp.]
MEVLKTWMADTTHSNVEFVVRHMMISKVRGSFKKYEIVFNGDPEDLENGKATAKIEVASIFTGENGRDDDLRSSNFFEVSKYPYITFESTKIEKVSDERYKVHGNLTIKNVTKEVVFDGELGGKLRDPYGNQRFGFSAETSINRREFGLTWNMVLDNGGVMVGDTVKVELSLEMVEVKQS